MCSQWFNFHNSRPQNWPRVLQNVMTLCYNYVILRYIFESGHTKLVLESRKQYIKLKLWVCFEVIMGLNIFFFSQVLKMFKNHKIDRYFSESVLNHLLDVCHLKRPWKKFPVRLKATYRRTDIYLFNYCISSKSPYRICSLSQFGLIAAPDRCFVRRCNQVILRQRP